MLGTPIRLRCFYILYRYVFILLCYSIWTIVCLVYFNLLLSFPCCVDSANYELPKLDRYKVKCVRPQPLLEIPIPYHAVYPIPV